MNTTVEALRALYVALGGTASDVANLVIIPDVINAIATVCEGRTALPSVSSSNNGKVLTVVSGKWKAADAPVELPAVTASNNGAVLKVVDGAWAIGTDAVE